MSEETYTCKLNIHGAVNLPVLIAILDTVENFTVNLQVINDDVWAFADIAEEYIGPGTGYITPGSPWVSRIGTLSRIGGHIELFRERLGDGDGQALAWLTYETVPLEHGPHYRFTITSDLCVRAVESNEIDLGLPF